VAGRNRAAHSRSAQSDILRLGPQEVLEGAVEVRRGDNNLWYGFPLIYPRLPRLKIRSISTALVADHPGRGSLHKREDNPDSEGSVRTRGILPMVSHRHAYPERTGRPLLSAAFHPLHALVGMGVLE
jgi:hypothetical protein